MQHTHNYTQPILMWVLPLLFFAYQFILRLWPGVMMPQIMEQFSIDATQFGIMAAFYYYGYAGMQIPMAILLDRWGARIIISLFAILCGLATLLFTYTDSFPIAVLSRFLIGVGSAVGFLGTSKVISQWFPPAQYARMIALSFTFGLMGAVYGGKPVSLLISHYGWQQIALVLAFVSIGIGCLTFVILKTPPSSGRTQEPLHFASFVLLLRSPVVLLLAIANLLMVGALEGFADVWGISYLMTLHNFAKSDAAAITSFIFVGMLFGGPLLALCARKWGNYTVMSLCGVGMAAAFLYLLCVKPSHTFLLYGLFSLVGVLCCYQVIMFAAGAELVSAQHLGVVIAFLNCMNMLGGSFFHTTIGRIMDCYGHSPYPLSAYEYALSLIPLCALVGAILIIYARMKAKKRVQ